MITLAWYQSLESEASSSIQYKGDGHCWEAGPSTRRVERPRAANAPFEIAESEMFHLCQAAPQ
jgi:hypothetical protein